MAQQKKSIVIAGLIACIASQVALAQVITSPKSGSSFISGDIVSFTADNASGCPLIVSVPREIGATVPYLMRAPYNFSVKLPTDLSAGDYTFSIQCPGYPALSSTVAIHVEPPKNSARTLITPSLPSVIIDYAGQTANVTLSLSYDAKDGTGPDISASNSLISTSSNPSVAVANGSEIIGISPGSASISFARGAATGSVRVLVRETGVTGDFTGDGIVDLLDIALIKEDLGKRAVGPKDARDLNHDGKIDALDLRILSTMCTYPRCASTKP